MSVSVDFVLSQSEEIERTKVGVSNSKQKPVDAKRIFSTGYQCFQDLFLVMSPKLVRFGSLFCFDLFLLA